MDSNTYDSENTQDYIYDPELTNKWYWEKSELFNN